MKNDICLKCVEKSRLRYLRRKTPDLIAKYQLKVAILKIGKCKHIKNERLL